MCSCSTHYQRWLEAVWITYTLLIINTSSLGMTGWCSGWVQKEFLFMKPYRVFTTVTDSAIIPINRPEMHITCHIYIMYIIILTLHNQVLVSPPTHPHTHTPTHTPYTHTPPHTHTPHTHTHTHSPPPHTHTHTGSGVKWYVVCVACLRLKSRVYWHKKWTHEMLSSPLT